LRGVEAEESAWLRRANLKPDLNFDAARNELSTIEEAIAPNRHAAAI
jgi:hypothetical protein